jgi:dienelactone hydrolase
MNRALALIIIFLMLTVATIAFGDESAKPDATGHLHLTFTQRSPLSAPDVVIDRLDELRRGVTEANARKSCAYELANESFDAVVPAGYRPSVPHGLFVWMGVTAPSPEWMQVLARHKMIFIAANARDERSPIPLGLRLDAVHNMKTLYAIDERRIYVAGFSAGAGMATFMAAGFPDVFRGGLFLMGGTMYQTFEAEKGRPEPTVMRMTPQWKGPLDEIKKTMPLVLMRGECDSTYDPKVDRMQFEALRLDGFARATFLIVPGAGHAHPNASWFEKGVIALDESKPTPTPTTSPTDKPSPLPGQIAQARRLWVTAMMNLGGGGGGRYARPYLQEILDRYSTTPSAKNARELLKQLDQATTRPVIEREARSPAAKR